MRRKAARRWFVLAATAALLGPWLPSRAGDAPSRVTLRGVRSIPRAVEILEAAAKRLDASEVVVVFDRITFSPPPGHNEFRSTHDYRADAVPWLDALAAWNERVAFPISVAITGGKETVRVGSSAWGGTFLDRLDQPWWKDVRRPSFEDAVTWIRRFRPDEGGLLVLLAGELTPEQWVPPQDDPEPWRRRLLPVGEYWNEERIARVLGAGECALYVVAIAAEGTWNLGGYAGSCDATGLSGERCRRHSTVDELRHGCLLARAGDRVFLAGTTTGAVRVPQSGLRVEAKCNDETYRDNAGAPALRILVVPAGGSCERGD